MYRGKIDRAFQSRGEQQVKNIERPVRVYSLGGSPQAKNEPKPLPLPDKPSIAVLPFTNMSGDPEQEYFADGLVEDVITALSRFRCAVRHRSELVASPTRGALSMCGR